MAVFLSLKPIYAKSGCCSWHKGVCGCSDGRQVCCDGTYSPSCTCAYTPPVTPKIEISPSPLPKINPSPSPKPKVTPKLSPKPSPSPSLSPSPSPILESSPSPQLSSLLLSNPTIVAENTKKPSFWERILGKKTKKSFWRLLFGI